MRIEERELEALGLNRAHQQALKPPEQVVHVLVGGVLELALCEREALLRRGEAAEVLWPSICQSTVDC